VQNAGTSVHNGTVYVNDVFRVFVKAGESVACDSVIT
jgi:hypothetical protein